MRAEYKAFHVTKRSELSADSEIYMSQANACFAYEYEDFSCYAHTSMAWIIPKLFRPWVLTSFLIFKRKERQLEISN